MADIIVDTYKLNYYAQRISAVNKRIIHLDRKLDLLYTRVGLQDLWNLIQADALTCYSWRLVRCQSYLQQTATEFEQAERELLREAPERFAGALSESVYTSAFHTSGLNTIKLNNKDDSKSVGYLGESVTNIPKDIKSVAEALSWIEKQCGKHIDWLTVGFDIFVPESLQDAYTLTSGLLQWNLTLEDGWDVAKNILSENTKLAIICETLDYAFKTGTDRHNDMQKQIYEQLGEGDVLGVVFDGAEGFIDTIIGGSIDVIGDFAGGQIDSELDKLFVTRGISALTKYGTAQLGWNDGKGYSVGGLIGGGAEKISEGLDAVTDVITDATDVVTNAVTDGFKFGINWVKSCFD